MGVEDFLSYRDQAGVGDPGAIVAGADFAEFILAHAVERALIGFRIVLDGDLRGHAAHGVNAAAVAGLDEELHIALEEVALHGDLRAIGQDETGEVAELLNETEDVVPAAAVEAGGMIAELVQNFVHLKSAEDGFDQHGGADRALGNAEGLLGEDEDIVPEAGFQVALHLGEIEIRSGAMRELVGGVVEEEESEIEE